MSPRFVLGGGGNVPCVAEVVNRSLKADCTDFTHTFYEGGGGEVEPTLPPPPPPPMISRTVDSTTFNFGTPLGLSMRGNKLVEFMI